MDMKTDFLTFVQNLLKQSEEPGIPGVRLEPKAPPKQEDTDQHPGWLRGVLAENYEQDHPDAPASAMIRAEHRRVTGQSHDIELPSESKKPVLRKP